MRSTETLLSDPANYRMAVENAIMDGISDARRLGCVLPLDAEHLATESLEVSPVKDD